MKPSTVQHEFRYTIIGVYRPHDPQAEAIPAYLNRTHQCWQPQKYWTPESFYTRSGAINRLHIEANKRDSAHGKIEKMDVREHHRITINGRLYRDEQRLLGIVVPQIDIRYVIIGIFVPDDDEAEWSLVYFNRKHQRWIPFEYFSIRAYYTGIGALRRFVWEHQKADERGRIPVAIQRTHWGRRNQPPPERGTIIDRTIFKCLSLMTTNGHRYEFASVYLCGVKNSVLKHNIKTL